MGLISIVLLIVVWLAVLLVNSWVRRLKEDPATPPWEKRKKSWLKNEGFQPTHNVVHVERKDEKKEWSKNPKDLDWSLTGDNPFVEWLASTLKY